MDTPKESPKILSLCTGYGGIEIGLERVFGSVNILAHVEIEAYAIENLVKKMESGKMAPRPIWTNVKTLPLAPFRGVVDIITGGYPCQPFSTAGAGHGQADSRHLWPYIRNSIDIIRPRFCFFENVEGHIAKGLYDVLEDLGRMGYRTTWEIFSAAEVGAPHRRKRVFILAHLHGGGKQQREKLKPEIGHRFVDGRERMGDDSIGRRRQTHHKFDVCSGKSNPNENGSRFPARPGPKQYKWEKPRTIESRLGRTIYERSRRVDRLRLLGNGVMPIMAANAWETLIARFDGVE